MRDRGGPAPLYSRMSLRVCWGMVCPLSWERVQLKWHSMDLDRSQLTVWSKGAARRSLNTLTRMRTHTQGAPVARILHWARGENKGEGWSNVQSIGKKGQTQQGLKKALPQPFSLFSKSWPRISLCKSVCLKEQGQWILILFTSQSGPTKIHSIDGWQGVSTHFQWVAGP